MRKYRLRYERWRTPILGTRGTIRTVPENYYVADVTVSGKLVFKGIDAQTSSVNIDKPAVRKWWRGQLKKVK